MAQTFTLGQAAYVNKGAYNDSVLYAPLNVVTDGGGAWVCLQACTGIRPGVTTGWGNYWLNMTQGVKSITAESTTGGQGQLTITYTDGSTGTVPFSTTVLPDSGVTTQKLANGAVTGEKTDFSAGLPVNGPMVLTQNIGYGDTLPASGTEGQIFFLKA